MINPNMSATISILKKYPPCISMHSPMSKIIWTPHSPSEGLAEKASADRVP